ncbi:MAG: signal peptidase II [Hyphomicrobiales bacterium]|nr:signal peptidase II [Hyphomicrobiales bacterium]MCY4032462.1 signal peptidase II [Hyphomicrobiales bacterium]MCY4038463.1 signal peptidase II [Hyphomicrobiales bacterium]
MSSASSMLQRPEWLRLWGRGSALGAAVAVAAFLADLLSKNYLIDLLYGRFPPKIAVTPFFDIVLSWNRGISYGILSSNQWFAQPALIGIGAIIVVVLLVWLAHARSAIVSIALGMVIGGAAGNLWDRIRFGAVADFFSFHAWGFYWYIFNVADVWIVVGGAVLIWQTAGLKHRR